MSIHTSHGNIKNELICGVTRDCCSHFERPVQTIRFEFKSILSCISKLSLTIHRSTYGIIPFLGINKKIVSFRFLVLI